MKENGHNPQEAKAEQDRWLDERQRLAEAAVEKDEPEQEKTA